MEYVTKLQSTYSKFQENKHCKEGDRENQHDGKCYGA